MKFKSFEEMPLLLEVSDVADTLSIGRNKAYQLVNTGAIKALRLGNHYRIPREDFIEFLRGGSQPVA